MRYRLRLDRLEHLLGSSRVSQNHWAMRLGLSRGHWSDIRSGRHPYPSAKTRQRMVEVFGVAERDLFEYEPGARSSEFDFRLAVAARFELTSELGQGGMGTVYLANDLTLARVVALKMVAAEAVAGVGADQLLQEIALVSRLQHPSILPLFDAGERAGSPFYVMPWVREGSLGALLRKQTRLTLMDALSLLNGVAAGLGHAHDHDVLHCDVKPENILVQHGHAFVMDFGIARRLHSEASEWQGVRKELDFSAGTPAYVSPEQAAGDGALDRRSDVYSLACVAYEMLAGRTPWSGETTQQIVSRRFHEPPPPLQRHAPDVPSAVADVIERAMSIEPARRPATAPAFVDELRVAAGSAAPWRTVLSVKTSHLRRRTRDAALGPRPVRETPMPLREWFVTLRQDVTYALRQRRRTPALTLMAVLTLALGVGLTTAVFAIVNGVLLRSLPFPASDRIVVLQSVDSGGNAFSWVSSANWNDWGNGSGHLEASAVHRDSRLSVVARGDAFRANGQWVSSDFFRVLRARFVVGRGFQSSDAETRQQVVVATEGFWRRRLGAASIDGQSIQVNGLSYALVGVVAANHAFPDGTDVYVLDRPRTFGGAERNNINYTAIARLADGSDAERARASLSETAHRIRETDPAGIYSYGVGVKPLMEELVGDSKELLAILMGAAGFVLLIACANLASANLAQSAVRGREMAIRAAIGAATSRLVRQVLVDHVLVALVGGGLGVLLAWLLTRTAGLLAAAELPRVEAIAIDVGVLAFAFTVAAAAGLATGLLPALRLSRVAPGRAMESGSRGHVGGGRGLPGRVFVAAEVAMAVMLVIGAGLMVQSLRAVLARPLGYSTGNVVVADITLSGARYNRDSAAVLDYWSRLRQSLVEMPGSHGAALINWVPLVNGGTGFVEIEGKDLRGIGAGYRMISEGYFETMGMRLLAGRLIDETDRTDGPRVTVISRTMAERYWPGESPLGRRVRALSMEPGGGGAPPPWLTVVGVVSDARLFRYEGDLEPDMYVLYRQLPAWRIRTLSAVVRGSGSEPALMNAVRERVSAVDPGIPADLELLSTFERRVTASRRFTMVTLSVFGALALVLAAIGVYGVLSFAMAQRTRELAVRAALGADRDRLRRLVLGSGARVVGAGLAVGLVGAWNLTHLARSLLFEVEPRDPAIFAIATVNIALVGLLAAAIPAVRASRVEPMVALRED